MQAGRLAPPPPDRQTAGMRTEHILERMAAASANGSGRVAVVESSASLGFMAPLHAHAAAEAVHVLEGRMTIIAGTETAWLEPGETFVVAEGVAHTYRAESARTRAAFTTFASSAGRYEDFLRAAGPVTVDPAGAAAWSGEADAAAVAAIAAAADVTLLGPPGLLPADAENAARAA